MIKKGLRRFLKRAKILSISKKDIDKAVESAGMKEKDIGKIYRKKVKRLFNI